MVLVAGVDGCRAGWVAVLVEWSSAAEAQVLDVRLCPAFADVLALVPPPAVLAIDIPIGLLPTAHPGGRQCDREARQLLGRRASSVFSPPGRDILEATHYAQVRGHGMSRQAFGILPKIREVDRLMVPALQHRIYEAHPELAFRSLTGQPMHQNKKTPDGHAARLTALVETPAAPFRALQRAIIHTYTVFKRTQVARDDLLDACVLAWVAQRITTAQAYCVPAAPPVDACGLRMEIWY